MTVTEAIAFFADAKEVAVRLAPLADVGPRIREAGPAGADTVRRLRRSVSSSPGHLAAAGGVASSTTHHGKLFLFDEPTTGLHFEDVAKLLRAFRKLLAAGHFLLVIEHNLDLIRASDWLIDLGPEGGERGGEILCVGTPSQVRENDAILHGPGAEGVTKTALSQDAPLAIAIGQVSKEATVGRAL